MGGHNAARPTSSLPPLPSARASALPVMRAGAGPGPPGESDELVWASGVARQKPGAARTASRVRAVQHEGDEIGTSTDGQAQVAAATNRALGHALTAASGAGVRFSAWIMPTGAIVA